MKTAHLRVAKRLIPALLAAAVTTFAFSSSAVAACPFLAHNTPYATTIYGGSHTIQHGNFCLGGQCIAYTFGKKNSAGACYANYVTSAQNGVLREDGSPNSTCQVGVSIQATPPSNGWLIVGSRHFAFSTSNGESKCFLGI